MRGVEKIASVKTALWKEPEGRLEEGRFYAKPQPSQVSSVMSQRIPIFFMARCHFDLRQRVPQSDLNVVIRRVKVKIKNSAAMKNEPLPEKRG